MSKLVVLSFGNGSCEQGVQTVGLQIWSGNSNTFPPKFLGSLPPAPEITQLYQHWQSKYRQLGISFRIEATPGQVTNFSTRDVEEAGNDLKKRLNEWLRTEGFIQLRDKLLLNLNRNEEIRVIIETSNFQLQLLPWHLWEFFDYYPKAEVALSPIEFNRPIVEHIPRQKARLLAILGDSTGINVAVDRQELENIPNIESEFLVEPTRQQVFEKLWDERGWDVLFFAGHSLTEKCGTKGKIFINPREEGLLISKLKNTLKVPISKGLKLAMFNSCEGLGIASELASLHIPQTIVMREPVPDSVAQVFLKYFLAAFSRQGSLYLAVREARARLDIIEEEFPCASWLPVICQNPAESPLTWQELCRKEDD